MPAIEAGSRVEQSSASDEAWLTELKAAHEQLFAEMSNMDELTNQAEVDWTELSATRFRISQASLARRTLAARIIDSLLAGPKAHLRQELMFLREQDQKLLRTSAQHVSEWPLRSVRSDWSGYCVASRTLRAHMATFLKTEQRILYPILMGTRPIR